jgi:hypothetical protein
LSTNSDLEEPFPSTSGDVTIETSKKQFLEKFAADTLIDSNDDLSSDEEDLLLLLKQSHDKMVRK